MNAIVSTVWRHALDEFERLLGLDADARRSELEALERSNPHLHRHVETLIRAEEQASSERFLDAARPLAASTRVTLSDGEIRTRAPEATFGAYRLERALGLGGMGEVWLARRDDGLFEMPVALKLMHAHLVSTSARERFVREGRILGELAHPRIARLLDAGVANGGQLYLAIEYVEGRPIDTWCDERDLSIDDRLRLFVDLCDAVAHAHAHLVVHRDIKPSNVIVSREGELKLLDFGIAKLVESVEQQTLESESTRIGGRAFTPEYAAPEQMAGTPVSVATDVYGLGVLLHVLLTGRHPYARPGMTLQQIERIVRETVPPAPGCVVDDGSDDAKARAVLRGLSPARLRRRLEGDLDTIVGKALKKAQGERYATVVALADDVRRHLALLPILARPDSLAYRANLFVQRNRVPLAAAAAVVLALCAGVSVALWQAQAALVARNEATHRREQADGLINFMLGDFRERLQPLGRIDLLDAAVSKVMVYLDTGEVDTLDDEALRQRIRALSSIADIRDVRRQTPEAVDAAARAVAAARELVRRRPQDPDAAYLLASSLQSTVNMNFEQDRPEAARPAIDEGMKVIASVLAARPGDADARHVAALYRGFTAFLAQRTGDYAGAEREFRACASEAKPLTGREPVKEDYWKLYFSCYGASVSRLDAIGRPDEVVPAFEALLAEEKSARQNHPGSLEILLQLQGDLAMAAGSVGAQGRHDLARDYAQESVELGRELLARDPENGDRLERFVLALWGRRTADADRRDWAAVVTDASEEIAAARQLVARRETPEARERLISAITGRAYARAQLGDVEGGIGDWRAAIDLGRGVTSPITSMDVEKAQRFIWEYSRDRWPAQAREARLRTLEMLDRMDADEAFRSDRWQTALLLRRMRFAYLDGDAATGDRLYAQLVSRRSDLSDEAREDRPALCAWIAAHHLPPCGPDIPVVQ